MSRFHCRCSEGFQVVYVGLQVATYHNELLHLMTRVSGSCLFLVTEAAAEDIACFACPTTGALGFLLGTGFSNITSGPFEVEAGRSR